MARHRQWHISGWVAVLFLPVAIPVGLLIEGFTRLFGLKRTEDLNPADVAGYINNLLNGVGTDFDWDDFTSIPITDPRLEAIRQEAELVHLPLDDAGRLKLLDLYQRPLSLTAEGPWSGSD